MNGMSSAQSVIAAMLTPALLILAAGSLVAAALVRLARVVDRVRSLNAGTAVVTRSELSRYQRRSALTLASVTAYFVAVALFVGSGIAIALDHHFNGTLTWLPISLTLAGMTLIVAGAAAMAAECYDSGALIASEIAQLQRRAVE